MVWTWKILCRYHTSWMETYFLLVVSEKLCSMMSTLKGVCLLGVLSRQTVLYKHLLTRSIFYNILNY